MLNSKIELFQKTIRRAMPFGQMPWSECLEVNALEQSSTVCLFVKKDNNNPKLAKREGMMREGTSTWRVSSFLYVRRPRDKVREGSLAVAFQFLLRGLSPDIHGKRMAFQDYLQIIVTKLILVSGFHSLIL